MRLLRIGLVIAILSCLSQTVSGQNEEIFGTISGTVSYLQRSALPANATIRVRLEDVSRQDIGARTIAEVSFPSAGRQVPFPFLLPYHKANIVERNRYQVRAAILLNNSLLFTSTQATPVLNANAPAEVAILVQ